MKTRVHVIVDNFVARHTLKAEHGLSMLVEREGHKILFDTGQSGLVVENAAALNLRLQDIEAICLSHGHYDHCGGLQKVLEKLPGKIPVFVHEDAFAKRVAVDEDGTTRHIGVNLEGVEKAEFVFNRDMIEVAEGVYLSGQIERQTDFEGREDNLKMVVGASLVEDPFLDDQALFIEVDDGLLVLLGCAHAGIINTLYQAQRAFPNRRIVGVMGGSHLMGADRKRLERIAEALEEINPAFLGLCHCTGLASYAFLRERFGDKVVWAGVGSVLEI